MDNIPNELVLPSWIKFDSYTQVFTFSPGARPGHQTRERGKGAYSSLISRACLSIGADVAPGVYEVAVNAILVDGSYLWEWFSVEVFERCDNGFNMFRVTSSVNALEVRPSPPDAARMAGMMPLLVKERNRHGHRGPQGAWLHSLSYGVPQTPSTE